MTVDAAAPTAAAAPVAAASAAVASVAAPVDAHSDAIAAAKLCWLQACSDGSSPAQVQALYEAYRDLVIAQVAAAVQGRAASAS